MGRWLRWIYVLCYFKIHKIRPTATTNSMHNKLCKSCDMFEDKCVWSALYAISNHSHICQLQFATHAFSQQVLQQAVQISICQWIVQYGRHWLQLCMTEALSSNLDQWESDVLILFKYVIALYKKLII